MTENLTWVKGDRGEGLDDTSRKNLAAQPQSGTSIFDPVLCEMAYRWFCPPGGLVLDPFAGGSVRGIVAGLLGRRYHGVDLRAEQIEANRDQWDAVSVAADVEWLPKDRQQPVWDVGDSLVAEFPSGADLVFTCPPYADLEVYSDDPADISAMSWSDFRAAYLHIISRACEALAEDRFAVIVVGEVRGPGGGYRGLVPATIEAFEAAGLRYYNEAILVTAVGSLPLRVGKQFEIGRKIGKTHQNVLVFVKGDWRKATAAVGPVGFGRDE
jgi:hypothetical protein